MECTVIENGTTIEVIDRFGSHTFELVSEVPLGYEIWNIGRNMAPGYLPLCRPDPLRLWHVEVDTLKAIKIEGAEYILDAIGGGQNTLEKMERYVKRYRDSQTPVVQHRVNRFLKAIPIMKKIKWG